MSADGKSTICESPSLLVLMCHNCFHYQRLSLLLDHKFHTAAMLFYYIIIFIMLYYFVFIYIIHTHTGVSENEEEGKERVSLCQTAI